MAFITLEQYKNYAEITSPEKDRKLEGLINRVDEIIKSYCGIAFTLATYVEEVTLEGNLAFLAQIPAVSVTSVQYYDVDGVLTTIDPAEYRLIGDEAVLELTATAQALIATSKYSIKQLKVTYSAGYSSIPEDLKQGAMDLVKYYDKSEYAPLMSSNVRTIDYDVMQSVSLPPHIRRVLSFYRKVE